MRTHRGVDVRLAEDGRDEAVNAERGGKNLDTELTQEDERDAEMRAQQLYTELYKALQIDDPSYEKAGRKAFKKYIFSNATKGHGGQMMENYDMIMRKKINFDTREDALSEDLDPKHLPTAKERIEVLQAQLRIKGFDIGDENRRRCLAGILAARENVGAVRGGKNLKNRITDARAFNRLDDEMQWKLSVFSEEQIEKMNELAIKGHGGEMKDYADGIFKSEEFQKKYEASMDKQREELVNRRMKAVAAFLRNPPPGRDAKESELIQDTLVTDLLYIRYVGGEGMSPADTREALNSDVGRFVSTQKILKTEEFKNFKDQLALNPEIMEKAKNGDVTALFQTFDLAAQNVAERAQKDKHSDTPTVNKTVTMQDAEASL